MKLITNIHMDLAYRTNKTVVESLANEINAQEVRTYKACKTEYKNMIRPFVLPIEGIVKGDALKDDYFPIFQKGGKPYDIFISHSHNNESEAILLAAWVEKRFPGMKCFVDSYAWGSADQLLKEIDDKYCLRHHKKTYDYKKRNFTTSHVHAILSMSLLDIIDSSKYCIFIESRESISLSNGLTKKTFSPWLYEEISFMKLLQPRRRVKLYSEAVDSKKTFRCEYDVSALASFPFLDKDGLELLGTKVL